MPQSINRAASQAICHEASSACPEHTPTTGHSLCPEHQLPWTGAKASISEKITQQNQCRTGPKNEPSHLPSDQTFILQRHPTFWSFGDADYHQLKVPSTHQSHPLEEPPEWTQTWWNSKANFSFPEDNEQTMSYCASPSLQLSLWKASLASSGSVVFNTILLAQTSLRKNKSQKCSCWGIHSVLYWKLSSRAARTQNWNWTWCLCAVY